MNEPNDIPREKLAELLEHSRQARRSRDPRQRPGVHEAIRSSRSTLLINLIIEIASGLILLVGIAFTVKFLHDRKAYIEPGKYRLYLQIISVFTIGWFAYVGHKVRTKYRAFRRAGNSPVSSPLPPRKGD